MGQFEDMDAFVRIVDAGSISRAANQLGVVKSAISRRLTDLETRLGVQLLSRTTRRSSLTEAGHIYYNRAVQILGDVADINASTSNTKAALNGRLKISAPSSFGLLHLSPAINEFAELHPELAIHMDFNDRIVDLVDEGYDLAFRIAELKESSLIALKLAPVRRVICASPDYLARKGNPKKPDDLKKHDILQYALGDNYIWKLTASDGRTQSVNLAARMSANNGDFLKEAAVQGHGIILSPTFIVWKALRAGTLVPLLQDYSVSGLNAYAVYPETRHLPNRVRRLIDFLKQKFNGKPYWD
ncbi:MAG: LysR family transcriptional regulator [Alphaproteobacteria bacterium]|nr:LysR family transcriptional regulator [Alphaproteobacteria bacterium]